MRRGWLLDLIGLKPSQKKKAKQKSKPKTAHQPHQLPTPTSNWEAATVKTYNPEKGFGFLAREGQTKDVYVHKSLLEKLKIGNLKAGQKVDVKVGKVQKGLEAADLRLT